MEEHLTDHIFKNPYIVSEIMKRLDIRSVSRCHSISQDLFSAAVYECERRKDVIHLYLLNYNQLNGIQIKDVSTLLDSFRTYTKMWINIRPKYVFVMIGGYQQNQIDYRRRVVRYLTHYLPSNCTVVYLDVGRTILTSSIRYKSLTNYSEDHSSNQSFQRTAFPCMSSLLIPDIEGFEMRTYKSIEEVDTQSVKTVLLFMSSKKLVRKTLFETRNEIQTTETNLSNLMSRLNYEIAFGGGRVIAVQKRCAFPSLDLLRPLLCDHLIVTFGGNSVRTASSVISTLSGDTFLDQLMDFKRGLDFDCEDWKKAITVGYIFANNDNFSQGFTTAFQTVFPCVGIFGFQTTDRMYGKHFLNKDISKRNHLYGNIDPNTNSVIVLLNIQIRK